jgi:hypothetical protein
MSRRRQMETDIAILRRTILIIYNGCSICKLEGMNLLSSQLLGFLPTTPIPRSKTKNIWLESEQKDKKVQPQQQTTNTTSDEDNKLKLLTSKIKIHKLRRS